MRERSLSEQKVVIREREQFQLIHMPANKVLGAWDGHVYSAEQDIYNLNNAIQPKNLSEKSTQISWQVICLCSVINKIIQRHIWQ